MPTRPKGRTKPGVIRLLDANGTSTSGWGAAVVDAVRAARKEIASPLAVEVDRMWAELDGARVARYRVAVKVAYRQDLAPPKAAKGAKAASVRKVRRTA